MKILKGIRMIVWDYTLDGTKIVQNIYELDINFNHKTPIENTMKRLTKFVKPYIELMKEISIEYTYIEKFPF